MLKMCVQVISNKWYRCEDKLLILRTLTIIDYSHGA